MRTLQFYLILWACNIELCVLTWLPLLNKVVLNQITTIRTQLSKGPLTGQSSHVIILLSPTNATRKDAGGASGSCFQDNSHKDESKMILAYNKTRHCSIKKLTVSLSDQSSSKHISTGGKQGHPI